MAILIKTDGEVTKVKPENGTDFSWEEVHRYVGGYFEIVGIGTPVYLCVNEDGIRDCEPNIAATTFAIAHGLYGGILFGDVLVCLSREVKYRCRDRGCLRQTPSIQKNAK